MTTPRPSRHSPGPAPHPGEELYAQAHSVWAGATRWQRVVLVAAASATVWLLVRHSPFALVLVFVAGVFAFLDGQYRRQSATRPTPQPRGDADVVVWGVPARFAQRKLAALGGGRALTWQVAGVLALGWALVVAFTSQTLLELTATLALAGYGAWIVGRLWPNQPTGDEALRLRAGIDAAYAAARALADLDGLGWVLHNIDAAGGGDVGHVVLGPVAAVVETRSGCGHLVINPDGSITAGTEQIAGDPIGQVTRQANAVGRELGLRTYGIVCVPRATNMVVSPTGVLVCGTEHLRRLLLDGETELGPHEARLAAQELIHAHEARHPRRHGGRW